MNKNTKKICWAVLVLCSFSSLSYAQQTQLPKITPPSPHGPIPAERQMLWHHMEFYAFVHFTVNTYTDKEWGYGDEDPAIFNPTQLDARQWARTAKAAGMKGIIITAKHHDGFCLWPSKYTEHSVKHSPWKNGKGDVVGDLAKACKEYDLKLGMYLSPWDRNHPDYGKPEYITYYKNQLTELLTNYGEVFTVCFDGANGGTGYYGGAREERRIDRQTYYRWPEIHELVRKLQPNACMFSDAGPDIRWVGNEAGRTGKMNWARFKRDGFYPGISGRNRELTEGHPDGDYWVPAEVDTSIRPGWFYHANQDDKVKSIKNLINIYFASVGNNSNLLLNLPPDQRGLFHESDVKHLTALG
ncbi:MAG: alpha-L-fucosidase, partial [Planctomycetes bacterium]|nr:alpha-L-fucosidase [Planctomycetota bacterium]